MNLLLHPSTKLIKGVLVTSTLCGGAYIASKALKRRAVFKNFSALSKTGNELLELNTDLHQHLCNLQHYGRLDDKTYTLIVYKCTELVVASLRCEQAQFSSKSSLKHVTNWSAPCTFADCHQTHRVSQHIIALLNHLDKTVAAIISADTKSMQEFRTIVADFKTTLADMQFNATMNVLHLKT